jgi:hypothetical protein
MSDTKLPPQTSPTDTSNWDNKVFTTPVAKSVDKIIKNIERREMILNAPERKRQKYPKNPDIVSPKKR